MAVEIQVPTALRSYADGLASIEVEGDTVGEALNALTSRFAGLAKHLRDGEGKLRSFVNLYLNDEDVRYLQKEATPVQDGDVLIIVPSIAGGLS